ncbi:hypothetical protein F4861DRAFT_492059 [Xylaria intraflava]|nr:hypothetical protein F4861DRAFT_492059 [Xylaria intraflava]
MSQEHRPETEDGWMKVHRRKGRRLGKPTPAPAGSDSVATPSAPSLSLEQVKQDHDQLTTHWKSSSSCSRLRGLLSSHATTTNSNITRAICFGLGTFDPPDGTWEQRRKAHIQLAAFLAIVDHLQSQARHQIQCFFQDPIFNTVDRAFIASLGHEVVESPVGFELVEPETLVFGIHLYRDVYSQVIATHIPAIFIGTPYEVWEDAYGDENLDWARMKELNRLCVKVKFPENQADTTFSSTMIHWRQDDQS